ncbi:MAG TPA: hypothetical protein VKU84_15515 [Stellaceae bacterium]|nr:hypothetical protein [Stellaceae bacterium]
MRSLAAVIAVAGVASAVAACTSPIETIRASPESIELRWYTDNADFDQAQLVAQSYCAERARKPTLGDAFRDQDVSLATFECR